MQGDKLDERRPSSRRQSLAAPPSAAVEQRGVSRLMHGRQSNRGHRGSTGRAQGAGRRSAASWRAALRQHRDAPASCSRRLGASQDP